MKEWEAIRVRGRVIGRANATTGVYETKRSYPKDVARIYDAYGIDAATIDALASRGIHTVVLDEQRGRSLRRYTMPLQTWRSAFEDHLGTTGLPHRFIRLADLPQPEVLATEPCDRKLRCCGRGRCRAVVGHWHDGSRHECGACGSTEAQ